MAKSSLADGEYRLSSNASYVRQAELALINAPFEPDGWRRAIAMVATATASPSANLVGMGGPMLLPFNIFSGPNHQRSERYFADPALWGACNWRVGCVTVPMSIQHESHYRARREQGGTGDYDDAVSDLDIPFGCQSAIMMEPGGFVGLAMMRGRRDGPCEERTLSRFRQLTVTLGRAIRMQLAVDGEAAELMLGDLDKLSSATVLLDRHGNLCALTPRADDLFEQDGPLALNGLSVRLRRREEDRACQQAMKRLLAHDGRGPHLHQGRAGVSADQPRGAWTLYLIRLPARDHGLGFDPHLAMTLKPVFSDARWASRCVTGIH